MKLYLLSLTTLFGLLPIPASLAAPTPVESKNSGVPAVVLRVKSIDELLGSLKTTVKTFFPETFYKEFERVLNNPHWALGPNNLKGVAVNKPFGLYATLGAGLPTGDFSKSSAVALVPVDDQKAFLELLGKTGLAVEKKGEVYSIPIPDAPIKASLRFLNGYAYVIVANDEIDPKKLLEPKDLFAGPETAAVALRIYPERLPGDLKKAAADLLTTFADAIKNGAPPPNLHIGGQEVLLLLAAAPMIKMVVQDDVKEVVYRLDLDAKTGILVNELVVEPMKGSAIARRIAGLRPTKNDFAGIVGADSTARVLIQTPLFVTELQDLLGKALDNAAKTLDEKAANAPQEARTAIAEGFKALRRSIDDQSLDLAASLRGPDKNGQYTAVGAFSLKDTAALEKALKAAAPIYPKNPKDNKDLVAFDAFKVNGVNVHEIAVADLLAPDAIKVFGKSSVYVALAPNAFFITFGPQGKSFITEALTAKLGPKPASLLQVDISSKRLVPLFKVLGAAPEALEFFEKLAKTDRQPVLAIKAEGGDKLVLRLEVGLAGVYAVMPKAAKATAQPNVVPLPKK